MMEAYVGLAEGKTSFEEAHRRADEFFGNLLLTGPTGLPRGTAQATSGLMLYQFRRIGVDVVVEKRFITPQPMESLPQSWERIRGNLRVSPAPPERQR